MKVKGSYFPSQVSELTPISLAVLNSRAYPERTGDVPRTGFDHGHLLMAGGGDISQLLVLYL